MKCSGPPIVGGGFHGRWLMHPVDPGKNCVPKSSFILKEIILNIAGRPYSSFPPSPAKFNNFRILHKFRKKYCKKNIYILKKILK